MKKNKKNLLGQKFGELTVIKYDGYYGKNRKRERWIVKCGGCGKEYSTLQESLLYDKKKRCKECYVKMPRAKDTVNYVMWGSIRERCKKIGREFSPLVTRKFLWDLYLKQNKKCALSGMDIYLTSTPLDKKENTASLDRIDSSKGYLIDNVQWVYKKINRMKWAYSQDYFIELCGLVAEHNK